MMDFNCHEVVIVVIFFGPGAGFEKWWLVCTVEMQYRTYVTVVKGELLHRTTSIIVLAVAPPQ
jgi:hypothetical protein